MKGVFVTGTDTGVGKTVVSAALMHRYRSGSTRLRYWKPIQTGIEQDDDTRECGRLGSCHADELLDRGVRLERPLSPHLSARLSGQMIELDPLIDQMAGEPDSDRWIVEGAGGVLVPINESDLMVDLMSRLGLPVVVVSRTALGTINHTLLTIHALRSRSLNVAGVVMVGVSNVENRLAIEKYGCVSVLGELPPLEPLDAGTLGDWAARSLDQDSRLGEWLQ